jgi:hypothetical protein
VPVPLGAGVLPVVLGLLDVPVPLPAPLGRLGGGLLGGLGGGLLGALLGGLGGGLLVPPPWLGALPVPLPAGEPELAPLNVAWVTGWARGAELATGAAAATVFCFGAWVALRGAVLAGRVFGFAGAGAVGATVAGT